MAFKDKIRQRRTETVTVEGEALEVRCLNFAERRALMEAVRKDAKGEPDNGDFVIRLVIACTYQDGAQVFTEADAGWLETEGDGEAVTTLVQAATRVNGFEAPEKNSVMTPS